MIEDIIQDILTAKKHHAYISALSLALTLPNILSNIECGQETSRKEYIEWFNKWVYKYYKSPDSENKCIVQGVAATKFDGDTCYRLRCALLHSGNLDLKDKSGNRRIDWFELNTSGYRNTAVCNVSSTSASNVWVSINVIDLIDSLVDGATEFIAANTGKLQDCKNQADYRRVFGGIKIEKR